MNASALPMLASLQGFLDSFDNGQRFVLTLVLIGCVTAVAIVITITLATVWANNRQQEREMELRRDLLDAGRSADEIEQILRPADAFSRALGGWCGGKRKRR